MVCCFAKIAIRVSDIHIKIKPRNSGLMSLGLYVSLHVMHAADNDDYLMLLTCKYYVKSMVVSVILRAIHAKICLI